MIGPAHSPLSRAIQRMHPPAWLLVAVALTFGIVARICVIIAFLKDRPARRRESRDQKETCHLAVFLGSGGHSSETLTLVCTLYFSRYTPRTYLVSEGNSLSATKAIALERLKATSEQSLVSTRTLVANIRSSLSPVRDACIRTYSLSGLQFLISPSPKLVYVETFARVRTLSLTGKLLRFITDKYELPLH
ncbi:oligosaccharide biosynthesis protein Alg14 like protein [Lactarius vividus]|nr:oligosaccharide biosynthesis protein Alg14 like protein [Lactarius vividus]